MVLLGMLILLGSVGGLEQATIGFTQCLVQCLIGLGVMYIGGIKCSKQ